MLDRLEVLCNNMHQGGLLSVFNKLALTLWVKGIFTNENIKSMQ